MLLKNNLKSLIFFILNVITSFLPKNLAAVLLYHAIDENEAFLSVSPEVLRKQMKYLASNKYKVISLSDLVALLERKQNIPKKTVVLTFDDGFESHYKYVVNILKEFNFPATFYICTGLIGAEINNSQNLPLPTATLEEIKEMNKSSLIDIEPHGVNHFELDRLNDEKINEEIKKSKDILEQELNKKCNFFAPPRGAYNDKVIQIIKNHGFKSSMTIHEGLVSSSDDLYKLKRNTVDSSCDNDAQFAARLGWSIIIFNYIFIKWK
jgi:peptidoglycan/xylan/chitin deacetylase (PgdA/CDA1 family)